MKLLNKEQLEQKLEDPGIVLINVLARDKFKVEHIPLSVNVPADAPDFIRQVERKVEDKNQGIVVYCAGPKCDASTKAAEKLEKAGYKRVHVFKGGLEEWKQGSGEVSSLLTRPIGELGETAARF